MRAWARGCRRGCAADDVAAAQAPRSAVRAPPVASELNAHLAPWQFALGLAAMSTTATSSRPLRASMRSRSVGCLDGTIGTHGLSEARARTLARPPRASLEDLQGRYQARRLPLLHVCRRRGRHRRGRGCLRQACESVRATSFSSGAAAPASAARLWRSSAAGTFRAWPTRLRNSVRARAFSTISIRSRCRPHSPPSSWPRRALSSPPSRGAPPRRWRKR